MWSFVVVTISPKILSFTFVLLRLCSVIWLAAAVTWHWKKQFQAEVYVWHSGDKARGSFGVSIEMIPVGVSASCLWPSTHNVGLRSHWSSRVPLQVKSGPNQSLSEFLLLLNQEDQTSSRPGSDLPEACSFIDSDIVCLYWLLGSSADSVSVGGKNKSRLCGISPWKPADLCRNGLGGLNQSSAALQSHVVVSQSVSHWGFQNILGDLSSFSSNWANKSETKWSRISLESAAVVAYLGHVTPQRSSMKLNCDWRETKSRNWLL